jgi:MFS family permease
MECSRSTCSWLDEQPSQREIFWRTSFLDRNLSSISQAGLVNNLNDGMAWGLFPLFFAAARMDIARIATLAAIYPATWGIAQLFTGAFSDRVGRKWLIAAGMWVQAVGIVIVTVSGGFAGFAVGAVLLGIGPSRRHHRGCVRSRRRDVDGRRADLRFGARPGASHDGDAAWAVPEADYPSSCLIWRFFISRAR